MFSAKYWFGISILVTAAAQGGEIIFVDSFERIDMPRVTVLLNGASVPAEMAGKYDKAFNCASDEGGGSFSGVDHSICFRKIDGSSWRIWNTGCGWEIGRLEGDPGNESWERYARTYSGQCSEMPPAQIDTRALFTTEYFDGFGDPIEGVESTLFESDRCE